MSETETESIKYSKSKVVFMINANLKSGGGGERTLLSYIKYLPKQTRDRYEIKVVETTKCDRVRISDEEIREVIDSSNITTININYKFQHNKTSIFSRFLLFWNSLKNYLFLDPCLLEEIRGITKDADVIYLFHNSFSRYIEGNQFVVGSTHEWIPVPKTTMEKIILLLIKRRILWNRIDQYHYNSPHLQKFMPANSFYLQSGIRIPAECDRTVNSFTGAQIKLLFVGRLLECKGIRLILEAFEIVRKKGMFELHIVGGGEEDSLVNSRIEGVHFHGIVDDNTLYSLYEKCDLFIFPSSCDNLGLVILEAIYAGEYVIVDESLRGAFDELETIGVLEYSKHDPSEIAKRILLFKGHDARKQELAKSTIIGKYNWVNIATELFNKHFINTKEELDKSRWE